jgi:hypothetical protein
MIHEDSEPIHTWFSLSYSSHLVIDPVRYERLPLRLQAELATMLDQLQRSFPDVNPRGDEMLAVAAYESEYGELSADEMYQADVSSNEDSRHDECDHQDEAEEFDCDTEPHYYDWRGDEHDHLERVQVPTETEGQARAAGRTVVSRTLLQSMPAGWQARFVALLETASDIDAADAESYDIRFYTVGGQRTTDPIPHYSRGRTRIVPAVIAA